MADARDIPLIARIRMGDPAAMGELLTNHQRQLYNVVLRMVNNRDDAAELAQDAMLKIVEHIDDYSGQAAVSTWMVRIAMNLAISHLRKSRLRKTVSLDKSIGSACENDDQMATLRAQIADDREPEPVSRVQTKEELRKLEAALGALDEDFRAVLVLRDLQEMDYAEIGDVLSLPAGTVKSRLFRARLALRGLMTQDQDKADTLEFPTTQAS